MSSEQLAVQVSLRDDLINAAEPLPVWPSFGGRWREAPDDGTLNAKIVAVTDKV